MRACPFKLNSVVNDCLGKECQWFNSYSMNCNITDICNILICLAQGLAPLELSKFFEARSVARRAHIEREASGNKTEP